MNFDLQVDRETWAVKANQRAEVDARARAIQKHFRSETGFLLAVVQRFGTSYDGNAARRFFDYPETQKLLA